MSAGTTWLQQVLRPRTPERGKSCTRNIRVYDSDMLVSLEELARREGTTVSAVICNLCEDLLAKTNGPQKTMDNFALVKESPSVFAGRDVWERYLKTAKAAEVAHVRRNVQAIDVMAKIRQWSLEGYVNRFPEEHDHKILEVMPY